MRNSYNRLPDAYVPEVAVPDFGKLEGQAFSNVLRTGQVDEMGRSLRGQNALDDALKRGLTESQALDDVTSQGHGSFAMALRGGALTRQSQSLDLRKKAIEHAGYAARTVFSEQDKQNYITKLKAEGTAYDPKIESMSPDEIRNSGEQYLWSFVPPEVKERLRLSQNQDKRAQVQQDSLLPGQVAQQSASLEHSRNAEQRAQERHPSELRNLENKGQKIINVPDPADVFGQKKIPHLYDPTTQEVTPLQPQGSGQAETVPKEDTPPMPGAKKAPDGK